MGEAEKVLSAKEMESFYGDFYMRSPRVRINQEVIPPQVRPLIPYAEFWGVTDDIARDTLEDEAPPHVRQNLKAVVARYNNALDEWLAGPAADHPPFSPEYIAFSAMTMAALNF